MFHLLVFDSRRGNTEENEADKLLGFYPDSVPNVERISLAGLLQGLHMFSNSLERPETTSTYEIGETDTHIWATFEAEPGIFLAIMAAKTWLPRHATQENLFAFLKHLHYLMDVQFCGVQYLLDKDPTGEVARASIEAVLESIGDDLSNPSSWLNRELRNPLTTLGLTATVTVPLPITLDVHSLCHRAQHAVYRGQQLVQNCIVFFNSCVLWSSLEDSQQTAVVVALAHTAAGATTRITSLSVGGVSASRQLEQLDNGFVVLQEANNGETTATSTVIEYQLPHIYCGSAIKYLLAYSKGDLLLFMLTSQPLMSQNSLMVLQQTIEPLVIQLLTKLAQECHVQGGELGHLPGWRYAVHAEDLGAKATPRSKISAMTHHGRAVATAMSDSMSRLRDSEDSVEICAKSTLGVWTFGDINEEKRSLVIREKKVDADLAQSIANIETSLQSLGLK